MGGANNICTDKTGTLTLNIMSVDSIYIEDETYRPIKNVNDITGFTKEIFSQA